MRLPCWAWLALSSLALSPLAAATRPRYGGTLTVELSALPDPSELPFEVSPLVVETLVRLNEKGDPEAQLAIAWQRDADRKRWRFSLRPKVVFHDGEPLTAANAAPALLAALKKKYGDVTVTAGGQTIVIQAERAIPDLLTELSSPRMAISRKRDKNLPIGTGPFRVTAWEPGHRLTLGAMQDYWGGRPHLDSVIVSLGAARTNADVFDLPIGSTRRVLPERTRIWSSPPRELIALLAVKADPVVMQALALSIDRTPIVNVLTQRRGEAAYGVLPQWLSGYVFLFATAPDLARAKTLAAQQQLPPLTLSYQASDPFARSVADRIAVNARDAGIHIQATSNANANLRLVRWQLESVDAAAELTRLAALLEALERAVKPDALYEAERSLLDERRIIPLVYVPAVYGIAPRVHNWEAAQKNGSLTLHLENVWVEQP